MAVSFTNLYEVFLFILFCSVYVCSILWIYGDGATRNMGHKGMILPLLFITVGALALIKGWFYLLLVWPVAYGIWFKMRPDTSTALTD